MSSTAESATEIRPFRVDMPDEAIADLRRRIAATRWPSRELVDDRSQGVQLATIQELARYWAADYDWRACEARLNALPQFKTEIDGVDIHFIHVRSPHENALPLIITHGWPGSVIELLEVDRPAHRPDRARRRRRGRVRPGAAVPARLRLLRRAGRGRLGPRPHRAGVGGADAPPRLHPLRRPGRRPGRRRHRRDGPPGTRGAGRHPHELARGRRWAAAACPRNPRRNARRSSRRQTFRTSGFGYFLEQATRPQTIGYALLDSPVALAAWMLDHDTDSYYKISRAFVDGQPAGNLTRDHILDNITLYWLTGTGASAARSYWEGGTGRRPSRPGRLPRRSRSRSASPRSPARSSGPRAAGSRRATPTSSTSTRPPGAATSPPGKSPNCSRRRSARHSGRCVRPQPAARPASTYLLRKETGHERQSRCGSTPARRPGGLWRLARPVVADADNRYRVADHFRGRAAVPAHLDHHCGGPRRCGLPGGHGQRIPARLGPRRLAVGARPAGDLLPGGRDLGRSPTRSMPSGRWPR